MSDFITNIAIAVVAALAGYFLASLTPVPTVLVKNACQLDDSNLSDGTVVGALPYGKCVVTNADSTLRPNRVEWPFSIDRAGRYEVFVEYAAKESRPGKLYYGEQMLSDTAFAEVTGSWDESTQTYFSHGVVDLDSGEAILQMRRDSVFPHIRSVMLQRKWLFWPLF